MACLYYFEKYLYTDSFIHRAGATVKLVTALFYIIFLVTVPPCRTFLLLSFGLPLLVMIFLSKIPLSYFFMRSLFIIPFVSVISIFMPFYIKGNTLFEVSLFHLTLAVSIEGLQSFFSVMIKSWFSILAMILLNSTTPFPLIIQAFNNLHIPEILVINITFMYRYLFILSEEAMSMITARDCRFFGGFSIRQVKVVGNMAAVLFIRTLGRSERIYNSMVSRGFQGEMKTISRDRFCFGGHYFYTSFLTLFDFIENSGEVLMENNPAVKIENLIYTYPDGRKALDGISFSVEKGKSVGLIGHNGAGKSTLIMHLNGILMGRGRIEIMGISANRKNLREIRKKVGIVFQNPDDQLFMSTVFDDIAFGPLNMGLSSEEVENKVKEVIEAVGLPGFEKRLPHHLSFGEKKRIALATVLAMEPELLILDEPASNLDPKGRRGLIKLLKRLEITRIIATHDLELVLDLCSEVILMSKGKIAAYGETLEILSDEELLLKNSLEIPLSIKYKSVQS